MLIFLVGYMGCGKTTYGRQLAKELQYSFVDLDKKIESEQGCTISQLFEAKGEDEFRCIEREAMFSTFKMIDTVIATGGGTPCFFDNMEQLNQHGTTLYIEMDAKGLAFNLRHSLGKRPLLAGKTPEELIEYINQTLQKRLPFYTQAKCKVDGIGINPQKMIEALPQDEL